MPEPVTVTPPPVVEVMVPALAVRVTVIAPAVSTSARVTAERLRLEATSSVTVTSVGRLVAVGTSFTAVMSMLVTPRVTTPEPSLAVTVRVAALSPLALRAPV